MRHRSRHAHAGWLAGLLGFIACSPGPVHVSSSGSDPSSPAAAEAPDPLALATPAASGSAKATYVCPMHPDVTSTESGHCPKCGMNLVPKKLP